MLLATVKIDSIKEYQATPLDIDTDGTEDDGEDIAEFFTSFEKTTLNMRKEMENFNKIRYQLVMPFVTPEELSDMEKQADAVHAALKASSSRSDRLCPDGKFATQNGGFCGNRRERSRN